MAKRWEYQTLRDPDEETLNSLGEDGWELVSVIYDPESGYTEAFLKREKNNNSDDKDVEGNEGEEGDG